MEKHRDYCRAWITAKYLRNGGFQEQEKHFENSVVSRERENWEVEREEKTRVFKSAGKSRESETERSGYKGEDRTRACLECVVSWGVQWAKILCIHRSAISTTGSYLSLSEFWRFLQKHIKRLCWTRSREIFYIYCTLERKIYSNNRQVKLQY